MTSGSRASRSSAVEMADYEDWGSARIAQLEQQDLERYQRELESQRTIVQMRRPIQRFEMRVPDYYTRFCYWKEEMISVGYPDDESGYIDYFIGNLQWQIRLRVLDHRSSMSRLIDAYYKAHHHEVMIRLDEFVKYFRAANEIDEMAGQSTIEQEDEETSCSIFCKMIVRTGACNVFDEMSKPNSNEISDEIMVQIEEESRKDVSPNADIKVLDELPQPAFIETAEYNVLEVGEDTDSLQHSLVEPALKFYKSPKPALTGLHSFSNELVETVEGLFLTNQKDFKVACKAFDEMPWLFSIMPYGEINADRNFATPLDCVPRVFDPGLEYKAVDNNDIGSRVSMLDCDLIHSIGVKQYWDKMLSTPFVECYVGKPFKLILDPSGLNELHFARDDLCRTYLYSRHKNNQEYSDFEESCWTGDFEDSKEQQGHSMMRENDKYILSSFDPGGVSWPSSGYHVSNLKCFASASKLVPYFFSNTSSLFINRPFALNSTWDNSCNKLALLHNFMLTQPANLFVVALVKIKAGILLFLFDPGGSLPLRIDFDALKCLVADVLNFSIDWDSTIIMVEIISEEIEDKYSRVQLVFTKALTSLDIGVSKRCEDEAGCGQLALVVLSPSIMIEMSFIQVVPKIVVVSSDWPYKHLSMPISAIVLNIVPIGTVSSIYSQRALSWMLLNFSELILVTRWCARHPFNALGALGVTVLRTSFLRFVAVKLIVRLMLKDGFRKTEVFLICVWDPGLFAKLVYILEDKDVFKRVGNRILVMVTIRSIRDVQIRIEEGSGSMMSWRNETIFTNKDLRLPVTKLLKHLEYEELTSEVSSSIFLSKLKFELNMKLWLDVISMFGFYPGTGANEGQWNAYKAHVNVQCTVAVPFGIIDHLNRCSPFDTGQYPFPHFNRDLFELYMFCLDVILQLEEHILHKNKMLWRCVSLIDILPWSSVATLIQPFVCRNSERVEDMNRVVKFMDQLEHGDISIMLMTEQCKASLWLGALMLLTIYDVLFYNVRNAPLPRNAMIVEDAYGGYRNEMQGGIAVQTNHIIVEDWLRIFIIHGLKLSCSDAIPSKVVKGASMSRIFVWDPGVSFHHLEDKAVVEGKDMSCIGPKNIEIIIYPLIVEAGDDYDVI